MKGHFYIVYIKPDPAIPSDAVKDAMDKALDWYKPSRYLWIVYTTKDAGVLYKRLKPCINEKGRAFISKLDLSDRQGWMSKGFWEWIKKERE